jgi:hypothetical protein
MLDFFCVQYNYLFGFGQKLNSKRADVSLLLAGVERTCRFVVISYGIHFLSLMELEVSLPCPQKPTTELGGDNRASNCHCCPEERTRTVEKMWFKGLKGG